MFQPKLSCGRNLPKLKWMFLPKLMWKKDFMFLPKLSCGKKIDVSLKVKLWKKDRFFFQRCLVEVRLKIFPKLNYGRKIDVSSKIRLWKKDFYFFPS